MVPRSINDSGSFPAGKYPTLQFIPDLTSGVQGEVGSIFRPFYRSFAGWAMNPRVAVTEPQFSVSSTTIVVSKSKNNAENPAILNVVAQLPDGAEKVTWSAQTPAFVTTNVKSGITGNGQLKIVPASNAAVGDSGFILLDSVPGAATDSLRNGPLQIAVTIVN